MNGDELKNKLMQLSGINRPTRKETVDGVETEVEDWTEETTATTIQNIITENNRLENEVKQLKERYITDFLKPGEVNKDREVEKREIKIEDYINL